MASLALLVVALVFSFWLVAGAAVALCFLGFRVLGAALGVISAAIGVWLLFTLPYAPLFGIINLAAGLFAVGKSLETREKGEK